SSAPQFHDRQMRLAVEPCQLDHESIAGLAGDQDLRFGARRTARPLGARLNSRLAVFRELAEVNLKTVLPDKSGAADLRAGWGSPPYGARRPGVKRCECRMRGTRFQHVKRNLPSIAVPGGTWERV